MIDRMARQTLIEQLRERTQRLESACRSVRREVPTEGPALIDLLQGQGWPVGWLVEWQGSGSAGGVASWTLAVAGSIVRQQGRLIVIDPQGDFYPPGAVALGVPLDRLVVLRPRDVPAIWWIWEHVLRSPAATLVVGPMPQGHPRQFIRLRWAAEQGRSRGFLWHTSATPTSAKVDLRLRVVPQTGSIFPSPPARSCRVEVLSSLGPLQGKAAHVVLSHETFPVRLVAQLADSTTAPRRASGQKA
jgi:hypothetical protein